MQKAKTYLVLFVIAAISALAIPMVVTSSAANSSPAHTAESVPVQILTRITANESTIKQLETYIAWFALAAISASAIPTASAISDFGGHFTPSGY